MANKNKMRFCVVGCGNVALKYGIEAIMNSGVSELVVCVDHGIEKKEIIASRFGIPFELNLTDAINNYKFDAVYISTPTAFHKNAAIEAAKNGKHILCEKPLALNFSETEAMVNAAKENNVALFEGFMYQFHRQHIFVNQLIKENKIGEVFQINACFGYPQRPEGDFRLNKEKGGGVLLDAGCYTLHFARNFYGEEPTEVSSVLNFKNNIDLRGSVLLGFGKEKTAHLSFGMNNFYKNQYELWGTKGAIRVERAFSVTNDYRPIITMETDSGKETFELDADNHFVNEVRFFVNNHSSEKKRKEWYEETLLQSELLERVGKEGIKEEHSF